MSTWTARELSCPGCGATLPVRVALGINVGRAPEARAAVLARRLHRAQCACGAAVHAIAAFEYADLERHELVIVALPDQRGSWKALEAQLAATVHRLFECGSPLAHPLADRLRSRVVFGDEGLREKLVVWSAALDDGVIECVKIRAFAADPALAAPGSRLAVEAVGGDDSLMCTWFAQAGDAAPARTIELPAAWVHEADRDRASLANRYPELFGAGYISASRFFTQREEMS